MRPSRPRIALILPYWSFWESVVPYDLRAERETLTDQVAAALAPHAQVLLRATVASRADGAAVVPRIEGADVDALLVLQTMAVPPAYTLSALESLAKRPVVIWAVHRHERVQADFDHAHITTEGATVGTPMLTSTLVRNGRPFELIVGRTDDHAARRAVVEALSAAAAASRLRRARVGRVGLPIDGYDCVDADDARLRAETGITLVSIEPAEVRELYRDIEEERVAELEHETRALYDVASDAEGDVLNRSLRAACAVEDLVVRHRLDAGAMNCHVPEIRLGEEVGIAPCFGLGRMTSLGVPWSCTGDVLTAVAMLAVKLLGGAANYHELESLDYATGEFVIASSGEYDLAAGAEQRPRLIRNRWFALDPHCGACACFSAPEGPATLVAFAQLDAPRPGYRFIVAPGEFTGTTWPTMGTFNAAFRFSGAPAPEAWTRWCRAGANHHSVATPGDLARAVETVARFLGVEAVRV
jgi:L-arabinose isomerase